MKVVILAGGMGTRISEESHLRPKPMIEIGGKPILWHIMKIYDHYGFNEFIICLGYKGTIIKEYFLNYYLNNSDITIDMRSNDTTIHSKCIEDFKVTLVDTGLSTKTAGRLKRVKEYLGNEEFMLTYGDGVADVNIKELVSFHKKQNKIVTATAIQPEGRFGALKINTDATITDFKEKPKGDGGWINGGFFVMNPSFFDYLTDDTDNIMLENQPFEKLSKDGQLVAFKHYGFWKAMDAMRDKNELEELWQNNPLWKVW